MNVERERLALLALEEALAWPPDEREQRLIASLAHDPQLLTDVRELLTSADAVNESLPTLLPVAAVEELPPPERVGPYRLGELLGKGGMGRVYRAERADGAFERTVALKLMRGTCAPGLVAAQFARERHILARLEHRNIAQLLDGGVTADGHSYFVMELVSGRPVTQYAADEQLSLPETLRLFLQICSAVQYAHTRLIVHADIKPNNIIVSDEGIAKLLDFGVARVLASAGTEPDPGPVGITIDYASPARRAGESPTTIDDVYSLGVVLDELLKRLAAVPRDLHSLCARAHAADTSQRYASVEALQDDVQRFLDQRPVEAHGSDWRYIARKFLSRHRVAVAGATLGVLLLFGIAVALGVLYMRAEHARTQAEERFADLRALSRFVLFDVYDRLETVPRALTLRRDLADIGQRYLDRLARDPATPSAVRLDVIEGLRRLAHVQAAPGAANLAQLDLARANLTRAEQLASALPDSAADRAQRSLILARIAVARAQLLAGNDLNFTAAHVALDHASVLVADSLRTAPRDEDALSLQADIAVERAATFQWQGRYADAIRIAREALSRPDSGRSSSPDQRVAALRRRARLLDIYAETTYYSGNPAAAEQPYREQLLLLEGLSAANPDNLSLLRSVERAGWALGTTLLELQRPKEAEPLLARSVAIVDKLRLLEPDDRELKRTASIVANAEAQALVALGRFSEALPVLERSLLVRKQLWDATPTDWGAARDYAIASAALADARADAGQIERACADYRSTVAIFDRIRAAGRLAKLDEDHALRLISERTSRLCH